MPTNLRHAVVVISGASSGIGQATAEAFARCGSRLVLSSRNAEALETVAASCRQLGAQVQVVVADVTDAAAVKALAETASKSGTIDVWVSNAGVGAVGRFEETPIEAHEQIIRTNLIGHINDAHAVVPVFLRQGKGVFINMISLGGFAAAPFATAYSASKFGLRGFSEALRAELADRPGIHVCDIYPAFVDTPGLKHGANYVERELGAPPPVLDPRTVAAAIVRVARHPKPTTTVGIVTDAVRLAHLLAPNVTARSIGRFLATYFKHAPSIRASDGNVFQPSRDAGRIDGGFRSRSGTSSVLMLGLAAIGFAGILTTFSRRNGGASLTPVLARLIAGGNNETDTGFGSSRQKERAMPAKSQAQQKAAGAALAAKRGDKKKSELKGASKSMESSMSEKELHDMASTKQKGKPGHAAS